MLPPDYSVAYLARVLAQLWPGNAGCTLLLDEPTSVLDPLQRGRPLIIAR